MNLFLSYLEKNDPKVIEVLKAVDAIEGYNGRECGLHNFLSIQLAGILGKMVTAGSDGHIEGEYGKAYMEIDCEKKIVDVSSLIWAIKNCKISCKFKKENL